MKLLNLDGAKLAVIQYLPSSGVQYNEIQEEGVAVLDKDSNKLLRMDIEVTDNNYEMQPETVITLSGFSAKIGKDEGLAQPIISTNADGDIEIRLAWT